MAFCSKCGIAVDEGATFCPSCGATQGNTAGSPPVATSSPGTIEQTQMTENIAALLSYVLGWLTGLVFILIDKRPFVRFHAAQSIVVFGGLTVIRFALGMIFGLGAIGGIGFGAGFGLLGLIYDLLWLIGLVLWIVLMVKAYQGEKFRVPFAADIAEQLFGKI